MSNDLLAHYHRTFDSNRFLYATVSKPVEIKYVPPNRSPTMGPPSSGRGSYISTRRYLLDAYYLNNNALEPIVIWERDDQKPSSFATPWELWWSKLFQRHQNFIPIVDANNTLVGHYGRVHGHQLLMKAEYQGTFSLGGVKDINKALEDVPMLVGNGDVEKAQGYVPVYREYNYYTVQTGIDGEVVWGKFEGFTNNGTAVPVDFSPMDLIGGAKLIIQLGMRIAIRLGARKMLTMVGRAIGKRITTSRAKRIVLGRGYDEAMGIPPEHLTAMTAAAKETGVIAIFRANKKAAIELIRQKAHGKPMWAKFKTSADTGVLTATTAEQRLIAFQNNAFVVDADLVGKRMARRVTKVNGKEVVETVQLNGQWKVEAGQVVARDGKPYVGDYDLLGVAPMKSPGSNVSLVPDDVINGDWNGPWVKKYANAVNSKLDQPRVLHGAQDAYGGKPEYRGLTDDTAYAVFPDGSTYVMKGRKEQEEFYDFIGRKAKSADPAPIGDPNHKLHVVK